MEPSSRHGHIDSSNKRHSLGQICLVLEVLVQSLLVGTEPDKS